MRPGIAALGLCLLLANPAVAQQVTPADLTQTAARIAARESALSQLWPGYWPEGQAFILHHPSTGAVFAGGASPRGPEFRPGPLADAHSAFELDYPSGAPNTVALKYDADVAGLSTLFHEQFHDYQSEAFRWVGGGFDEFVDLDLIPDLAAFAAAAEIERRVLVEALREADPRRRRLLAREYLALRDLRLAGLDARIADAEAHREWSEGTAEYVGLQGAALVADAPGQVRAQIEAGLRRDLMSAPGGFAVNWFRWRAYGVGAALAWLLDDQGVEWRRQVENGARLDVLLAAALDGTPAPAEPGALLRQRGAEALTTEMRDRLQRAPRAPKSREEFLATAPLRLVFDITGSAEQLSAVGTSFQSDSMTSLPDGGLALADASYFNTRVDTVVLNVTERPVLMEHSRSGPRHIVLLQSFEGLEPLWQAENAAGPHAISLDLGWLRVSAPSATIERGDDEIRIILAP